MSIVDKPKLIEIAIELSEIRLSIGGAYPFQHIACLLPGIPGNREKVGYWD